MWSTFITRKPSVMSGLAANSDTRLPSRNCVFSTNSMGRAAAAGSPARNFSRVSLTCGKQKPLTTMMREGRKRAAKDSTCSSSGLPATGIRALGRSRVSVPSRLPSPAASSTTFMARPSTRPRPRRLGSRTGRAARRSGARPAGQETGAKSSLSRRCRPRPRRASPRRAQSRRRAGSRR